MCVVSRGRPLSSPSILPNHRVPDPRAGALPPASGSHATSGNHWDAQMASRLAAKIPRGQKASPSQCQSSASDHGPQWTQQNPAPQTRRCLATREDGASNEGSGRHTSFQKARVSGSCPSCSGISLEPCLWGQPRAEGRPELDVSMVQPRCSGRALALLGVIFPIWKSIWVVASESSLGVVQIYGASPSYFSQ